MQGKRKLRELISRRIATEEVHRASELLYQCEIRQGEIRRSVVIYG